MAVVSVVVVWVSGDEDRPITHGLNPFTLRLSQLIVLDVDALCSCTVACSQWAGQGGWAFTLCVVIQSKISQIQLCGEGHC